MKHLEPLDLVKNGVTRLVETGTKVLIDNGGPFGGRLFQSQKGPAAFIGQPANWDTARFVFERASVLTTTPPRKTAADIDIGPNKYPFLSALAS